MAMGIPARIFATLLRISPGRTRNWLWKWWYQRLAKAHNRSDFRFMNYGFIDDEGPELDDEDEVMQLIDDESDAKEGTSTIPIEINGTKYWVHEEVMFLIESLHKQLSKIGK